MPVKFICFCLKTFFIPYDEAILYSLSPCSKDLRAVSAPRLAAFVFTAPADNNEAFIYAGSKIDVRWSFQSKCRCLSCSIFSVLLCKNNNNKFIVIFARCLLCVCACFYFSEQEC